jgi:serine/threonine protein kinase
MRFIGIGAGGMGEVYRAHDPRMGRDVVIKVSAERFSDRFSREVHAVAALNHPNIFGECNKPARRRTPDMSRRSGLYTGSQATSMWVLTMATSTAIRTETETKGSTASPFCA